MNAAELALALANLSGVSQLCRRWSGLLCSAVRQEALLISQIEGTRARLVDLSYATELLVRYRHVANQL